DPADPLCDLRLAGLNGFLIPERGQDVPGGSRLLGNYVPDTSSGAHQTLGTRPGGPLSTLCGHSLAPTATVRNAHTVVHNPVGSGCGRSGRAGDVSFRGGTCWYPDAY